MNHPSLQSTSAERSLSGWDRFWFSSAPIEWLRPIRAALAVIAFLYFASHWSQIGFWFGPDGVIADEVFARIVSATQSATQARWRLSPLFLTESVFAMRGYLVVGMALAVIVALGRGGRWAAVALWLVYLGLANRATLIAGLVELPLAFGLGYAAIAPAGPVADRTRDWTAGLAMRLLQVHTSLWIVTIVLTQLAGLVWWNGTAAFALAAPTQDRLFDLTSLLQRPMFSAMLTHLLVAMPLIGLPLAWIPRTNRYGVGILVTWWVVLGLLSSQLMYAAAMIALVATLRSVPAMATAETPP